MWLAYDHNCLRAEIQTLVCLTTNPTLSHIYRKDKNREKNQKNNQNTNCQRLSAIGKISLVYSFRDWFLKRPVKK